MVLCPLNTRIIYLTKTDGVQISIHHADGHGYGFAREGCHIAVEMHAPVGGIAEGLTAFEHRAVLRRQHHRNVLLYQIAGDRHAFGIGVFHRQILGGALQRVVYTQELE